MYSQNEAELIAIGQSIMKLQGWRCLGANRRLGRWKTTLTKGIAQGLGNSADDKSPTYTIVRAYEGRLPFIISDVYRIGDDPDSIDLDDFLYGGGVLSSNGENFWMQLFWMTI